MFVVWMFVSMLLPLAFLALATGLGMLFIRNAEISQSTVDRVRRQNPISPYERYEPAPMHDARGNRSWESALESASQRIRRRSMGGYH
jgi:hypothetical protein